VRLTKYFLKKFEEDDNLTKEKIKTIKFSHFYEKLNHSCEGIPNPPQYAKLLEVFLQHKDNLHPDFIDYDTTYFNREKNKWEQYKLPDDLLIVLLFKSDCFLFTTLRRFTPKKYEYYRENRGKLFKIVLENLKKSMD